jgi:hypothetical protein
MRSGFCTPGEAIASGCWGSILLFLDPSLILFSIGLLAVGSVWFALWLVYLLFVIRYFPRVQTPREF